MMNISAGRTKLCSLGASIALTVFSLPSLGAEPASPEIIRAYKYGYQKDCIPETQRELHSAGMSLSDAEVASYCDCVGEGYFGRLTAAQHKKMKAKKWRELPVEIAEKSEKIQNQCFSNTRNKRADA